MALPYRTTGSLCPSFDPDRLVGPTVKQAYAIALRVRLPSVLSLPLKASVTFLEATTPVKLPTKQCLPIVGIRNRIQKGRYFKSDSTSPGEHASISPAYPTHPAPSQTDTLYGRFMRPFRPDTGNRHLHGSHNTNEH